VWVFVPEASGSGAFHREIGRFWLIADGTAMLVWMVFARTDLEIRKPDKTCDTFSKWRWRIGLCRISPPDFLLNFVSNKIFI